MTLFLLVACNSYEVFRVTGFEQANFSNDADIVFVIDNSTSMEEETSALALNIDAFINKLTSADGANVPRASLTDAVGSYVRENGGESLFIDYQLAITTTTTDWNTNNNPGVLDPGEAGYLLGPVIERTSEDPAGEFRKQMLCSGTCWNEIELASDPNYVCGDAPGAEITLEYLDCICGVEEWQDHCGGGDEEGIEAGTLATCRGLAEADRPDGCYEYVGEGTSTPIPTPLADPAASAANEGLLREGAATIIVVVTDEGDGSPRVATGDNDVEPWIDLYADMPQPVRFAVLGPAYDGTNGDCLAGAQPWAVERYQNIATQTGGAYIDLQDLENDCASTDVATNLETIGQLLSTLLTLFPLQQTPDVATIEVWVDGAQVAQAELLEGSPLLGNAEYGDGWTYTAAYNAVQFHGTAVPDYNSDVRIYYVPLGGMPREIPF
jgi:hypothetical protein